MNIPYKSIIFVVGIIIGFVLIKQCEPSYIQKETTNTTTVDSTIVDSLQSVIDRYESIPPAERDTIRDTLRIPVPVFINDSTYEYTTAYSDSTLGAIITSKVSAVKKEEGYAGILKNQDFSYFLKREKVREITNTIQLNTVYTNTTTETIIKDPKPYLSIGAQVGSHDYGPVLSYTNPDKVQLFYRYGINHSSHSFGFTIPIF